MTLEIINVKRVILRGENSDGEPQPGEKAKTLEPKQAFRGCRGRFRKAELWDREARRSVLVPSLEIPIERD